jgi:hypothetical protein
MQNAAAVVASVPEEPYRLHQEIALSDLHDVTVQRGFDVWNYTRGRRSFPARAEVTPRMLSDVLRNTALVRVLDDGEDYELRIVGDTIVQAEGRSFQGKSTSEIDLIVPGHGAVARMICEEIRGRRQALAFRGRYVREADNRTFFHETVLMPLGNGEQIVDHILAFTAYALAAESKSR